MTSILAFKDLNFSYGKTVVYTQAELRIAHPGLYGFIGPNGSGKTTLFNLITGLLKPQTGEITLFGKENTQAQVFENLAYVQDSSVLYDYLTGTDHLKFVLRTHHQNAIALTAVRQVLDLDDFVDRPVKSYSLGQKQRLMIALALITDAPLILMDEPLNGLDPDSTIVIRDLLLELQKMGKTVIISSHNLDELDKVTHDFIFKVAQHLQLEHLETNAEARYQELYRSQRQHNLSELQS